MCFTAESQRFGPIAAVAPGQIQFPGFQRQIRWRVPYAIIVIPMTLLTAWLLLSKPRAKPQKITEPVPIDGA